MPSHLLYILAREHVHALHITHLPLFSRFLLVAGILHDNEYAQVKRELWGVVSAIKLDRDYLIGAEVVIKTDCLPILGMMRCCTIPDMSMLRWIAYYKSLNPEVRHISGKDNVVADMLLNQWLGLETT